jgi:drug/metabolite transporter (DMT)-like permease
LVPFEIIFYEAPHDLTLSPILAILALGILGSGLANLMMNVIYRDAGPTIASTVTYVIPMISTSAGVLILNENVSFHEVIGAAVIISGLLLTQQRAKRASQDVS